MEYAISQSNSLFMCKKSCFLVRFSQHFFILSFLFKMSDDYVQWDVHASTDEPTPHIEFDDPLAQTEVCIFQFVCYYAYK